LATKIVKALGGEPPETLTYELFLDEHAERISKSKGNGLSIEEWLTYGPEESLALFMFQKPRSAKRLFFDVIPKAVDEYLGLLGEYAKAPDDGARMENPVWHIHDGKPPGELPVTFGLLLHLVSASAASNRDVLWGFIRAYAPGAALEAHPALDRLVDYALKYYEDFVRPKKHYRTPTEQERGALVALADALEGMDGERDGEKVQFVVYE